MDCAERKWLLRALCVTVRLWCETRQWKHFVCGVCETGWWSFVWKWSVMALCGNGQWRLCVEMVSVSDGFFSLCGVGWGGFAGVCRMGGAAWDLRHAWTDSSVACSICDEWHNCPVSPLSWTNTCFIAFIVFLLLLFWYAELWASCAKINVAWSGFLKLTVLHCRLVTSVQRFLGFLCSLTLKTVETKCRWTRTKHSLFWTAIVNDWNLETLSSIALSFRETMC